MTSFAHSHRDIPPENWHRLEDHLESVGRLAGEFASLFGSAEWGRLAGRWHDLGKYAQDFQQKLRAESGDKAHIEGAQEKVDHSSAGAVHAHFQGDHSFPLAWVIAGHHAGLADKDDLRQRLKDKVNRLEAALEGGAPPGILEAKIPPLPPFLSSSSNSPRSPRCVDIWIRMLFSALVDADFLDTEEWFSRVEASTPSADPTAPHAFIPPPRRAVG